MESQVVTTAFLLTLFAGLSTGIGSLISLIAKRTNTNFLSIALGLSAGVMIYVSFMEMLPSSLNMLTETFGEKRANLYTFLALFGGIAFIALIDLLVPKSSNPHEMHGVEEMKRDTQRLRHTGIITALTIGIHNFPEGIATFMTAVNSLEVAIPITVAIAIHNIPEGIAVAVPIYHATGSRKKAFWLSFSSGLAEPIGAIIAYFFLIRFWNPVLDALILAIIAGVMIYISLDELLPSAEKYGKHHLSIIGLVTGMVIMAISLYLFI
ncbi:MULTISPECIES: zinc transporter ZupT [Petrimonas]|jgi:ZIP family zinc transporter|uniref:Zinc transporter ZupT n=1 Tax=Petrimonas mucosa TaxID=1642646 RepID=A0A1G4G9D9_9BACT|nr:MULTISPECIES: zinc transporter ZupT [Petrimonas]MDD3561306.1 zinc transporter ZupT [Petrimonas mucosa]SCM59125.1 Zinc transporter ZupT {ECO:0000255/HAMAP-Rule:MF_00548} [Petrimonas mucosa]SFU62490.1 zinc transporter, ZIP family [Porphyromonadaceae bacterium KHP3R9]HHT28937.1 zinc transporter ZupT [Petrimonas mucosa]